VPKALLALIIADINENRDAKVTPRPREDSQAAPSLKVGLAEAEDLLYSIGRNCGSVDLAAERKQLLILDYRIPERNWLVILIDLVANNYGAALALMEPAHAGQLRQLVMLLEDALETAEDRFKRAQLIAERDAEYTRGRELFVYVLQLMAALAMHVNSCSKVSDRVATWKLHHTLAAVMDWRYKAADDVVREAIFVLDHLASRPSNARGSQPLAGDSERCRDLFQAGLVEHCLIFVKTRAWDFDTDGSKPAVPAATRCLRKVLAAHTTHMAEFFRLEGHHVVSRLLLSPETAAAHSVELQCILKCACDSPACNSLFDNPRFPELLLQTCLFGSDGARGVDGERTPLSFASRLRALQSVFFLYLRKHLLQPPAWEHLKTILEELGASTLDMNVTDLGNVRGTSGGTPWSGNE